MKTFLHTLLWLVEFVVGLAFILAVLIFLLPSLLSIDSTRATVLNFLRGPLGGYLSMEKAQVSWWNSLDLEGLSYTSRSGKLTLTCDKLTTPSSLWKICFGAHEIGHLAIENPVATITLDDTPDSTKGGKQKIAMQTAGISKEPLMGHLELEKLWQNLTPHLSGEISLTNGKIIVQGKDINDVRIENLSLEATLPQKSDYVKFSLSGVTRQGDQTGSLDWSGAFGPVQNPDPVLSIKANLKALPMLGIEQVASLFQPVWRGVLVSAIGATLDLKMELALSSRQLDLIFDASSSQFDGALRTTTQNGKISLVSPGHFRLVITPFLAENFFSLSPYMMGMSLANSPQATLAINQLEIPITKEGIDWVHLKTNALLQVIDTQFATPVLFQGIAFEKLKASLSTPSLEKELLFDTTTLVRLGEKTALVASSGTLTNPLEKASSSTMAISTKNFPVAILDRILNAKNFLEDTVGSSCDFNGGIDNSGEERTGLLNFSSSNVLLTNVKFLLRDTGLSLAEPTTLVFAPATTYWQKHLAGFGVGPLQIALQTFDVERVNWNTLKASGKATSAHFFFKSFSLQNPSLSFDIQGLSSISLKAQAEGLNSMGLFAYSSAKETLSLKEPFSIAVDLSPDQAASLFCELSIPLTFLEPLSMNGTVKPFTMLLGQSFLKDTTFDGTLRVPSVKVQAPSLATAIVKNAACTFNLATRAGRFIFRTDADVGCEETDLVRLHGEAIVRELLFQPVINMSGAKFLAKVSVEKLDTRFIDAWTKTPLSPLLGGWVSLKFDVLEGTESGSIELDATCEKGSFAFHLARAKDQLTLASRQPARANITLDKEGYKAFEELLGRELPVVLIEPCRVDLRITQLELPLKKGSLDLNLEGLPSATIDTILQTEKLSCIERSTDQPLTLNHLVFRFARPNLDSPLILNLKTAIESAKPGLVDIKGQIRGIHHSHNGWDFSHIHTNISANFQQLPSAIVDAFTTAAGLQSNTIATLFGDQISGTLQTNIADCNGPVSLMINSPSTRISLDGTLKNGVLELNEPFIAQATMTEGISRLFLQGVNPLAISAVRSEGPITCTIETQGFFLPILPWNIANAQIGHARVELGKLTCRNKGNINTTLGLLKLGQFSRSNDLTLWFAPIDISLRNGIVNCERTEILVADSLDICTWGEIDLVRNRVNAVLGLTSQVLSKAFGIKGLPENYILQIPMKGPIDDVKVDASKATTKIALLLTWQKASEAGGGILGGTQGALIGGLIGQLAKLPDSNTPAPPAKHPFPWENQPSSSTKPPKKKKSMLKPGEKPLKQLIKILR